jgi:hypothetical protein
VLASAVTVAAKVPSGLIVKSTMKASPVAARKQIRVPDLPSGATATARLSLFWVRPKKTCCTARPRTLNDWVTSGAARKAPLPAWEARRVTAPAAPVRVRLLPDKVAGPLTSEKVTGRPLLAEAARVNAASVVSLLPSGAKAMVCAARAAEVRVTETGVAGR